MNTPAEIGSAANRYAILAKLATGGMAEIFLARGASSTGVERHVVLKRILRNRASDAHFVRMFLDEARLAAQLGHPNVAQVYDIGRLGDSYFFTMEYVHGETVRGLLHRAHTMRRPLPVGCVLAIVAGAAAGLHHAHERIGIDGRPLGIVHRDVSPSNLMVSFEGSVKVVDFGVAKAADRVSETRSGTVKGKIGYLSPEQCRGQEIDRRTDLFSLGIVMWEMLTGDRLFRRNSDFESMTAIVTEDVPPPSTRRADVPPELDAIVLRLLAKRLEDRFQTAEELVDAIEVIAETARLVLSPSALARMMREMFGQRPEPWREIGIATERVKDVTVTGEPIPAELALPAQPTFEQELEQLPDLSVVDEDSLHSGSAAAVPVMARASGPIPVPIPRAVSASVPPPIPQHLPVQPSGQIMVGNHLAATVPGTYAVPPEAMRTTNVVVPAPAVDPSYSGYPVLRTDKPPERRRAGVVVFAVLAVAAIVVGVGVAMWWAGRGDRAAAGGSGAQPVVHIETNDAAVAQAVDAAVVVVATDAPAVVADAAVAVVADAAPAPSIVDLVAAGKYEDAATACAADATPSVDVTVACTLAACKLHRDAAAKKLAATLPSARRTQLVGLCPALRDSAPSQPVNPPVRPPPSNCAADPMACPH